MRRFIFIAIFLLSVTLTASAQFGGLGGMLGSGDSGNTGETNPDDTASYTPSFSFKQYFNALAHKDTMKITWSFGGSIILPGTSQIYNKDYWKLPVLYLGAGALAYGGWRNNVRYQRTGNEAFAKNSQYFYIGAAFVYWASLLDGVANYESSQSPLPGRAALYSALCPGLGQMYNGDYWKLPIFYGILTATGYFWYYNDIQYKRYKTLYNQASTPDGGYTGNQSTTALKHYRDTFRRYRDYSIIFTALGYVLQIIDADVFATMSDFDVSDDLTFNIKPTLIEPITIPNGNNWASISGSSSVGLQFNLNF